MKKKCYGGETRLPDEMMSSFFSSLSFISYRTMSLMVRIDMEDMCILVVSIDLCVDEVFQR